MKKKIRTICLELTSIVRHLMDLHSEILETLQLRGTLKMLIINFLIFVAVV